MADWPSLPCDLLSEIASKLDAPEDFVYFSIVCHSFNRAYSRLKSKFCPKTPWLLLAENTKDNPDSYRNVFSLCGKRYMRLKLPQTFGARCWGSSCGWFVIIDVSLQLYMFNPLTHARIDLPPQSTMANQPDEDSGFETQEELNEWIRRYFIAKAFVIEVARGDFLVFALSPAYYKELSFARPGDDKWTLVSNPQECGEVYDVCLDGRRIYILYLFGKLAYFDISEARCGEPLIPMGCLNLQPPKAIKERPLYGLLYMLKSFGDLLMVLRYKKSVVEDNSRYSCRTIDFEVYRLNVEPQKWEQLNDLGDVAIFLGENHSMSIHGFGNCKLNSLYFTDDQIEAWRSPSQFGPAGGHDMGFFDMQNGKIEAFYDGKDIYSEFCPPFWFMPRL